MINSELSKIFFEMAELLQMDEVSFKPRAYEKAAHSIASSGADVKDIYKEGGFKALLEIPGVGQGIAEKIEEYIKTGRMKEYEKMKKKTPVNVLELSSVEGVGPKLIKLFYGKLNIRNIKDLEKAAKEGKLAELPRSGKKLEEKILKSIEFYKKSHKRFLLGDMLPLAKGIESRLKGLKSVKETALAGSLRRAKETIGDLDILAVSSKPKEVMDYFALMPEVEYVYGKGLKKTMVRMKAGIDADLRVVEERFFGAAWQYFTGSKTHNIKLRQIAARKGYKLNEYGLFRAQKYIAGRTEEEIYKKLGLQPVPPEMRENNGEIELALKNKLPKLVEEKDIKGDLQIQTNWTDGANTIEEYAEEAKKFGYEYILITDHTKSLAMTGGLDEKGIERQMKEIKKINDKLKIKNLKFKILSGSEVNIMKDGFLDIDDKILEKLDIVGAAIHSHFRFSKEEQTKRLMKAMENPHVDIIFHPTTRIIQQRPEIELDMEEIFRAAKRTGTVLEINAFPNRLDLKDDYIRQAGELGVKFLIDTDAHSVTHLPFMKFGVLQARRGWCEKSDIINTMSLEKLLEFFRKPKTKRFV